jgi:integrase
MGDMPRPRKPYLHRYRTRHGKFIWYVRKPRGNRVRIKAEFGTPDFEAEYNAAIQGKPVIRAPGKSTSGSLAWLWERYKETGAWSGLSAATRRQRANIMDGVLKVSGSVPCANLTRQDLTAGRDRRSKTPAQARNFLDAMRGLLRWAYEAGHIKADPTLGVKNPPRRAGPGFPAWSEDDVALYEAKWPLGTKERVWLDVLRYTGLRRGDAVTLGRQHVRNGEITLRTEKSGEKVTITLVMDPDLTASLAAGPCGELAFIVGDSGKPLTKETFGNFFRAACRAAGVKKSAHGVRKFRATQAAESDCTVAEMEAMFGWSGGGMASLYTRTADRAKLSRAAAAKLGRQSGLARGAK